MNRFKKMVDNMNQNFNSPEFAKKMQEIKDEVYADVKAEIEEIKAFLKAREEKGKKGYF